MIFYQFQTQRFALVVHGINISVSVVVCPWEFFAFPVRLDKIFGLHLFTDSSIPNKIDSFLYVAQSYFRCMSKIASPVVFFHFNYTFAKKKTDNCG